MVDELLVVLDWESVRLRFAAAVIVVCSCKDRRVCAWMACGVIRKANASSVSGGQPGVGQTLRYVVRFFGGKDSCGRADVCLLRELLV